jgi:phosphoribosylformylglycinamidine synthase
MSLPEDVRAHVTAVLGRAPNALETDVLAAMASEHCSYASSRALLRTLPRQGARVRIGPGENAGVVDIGHGRVAVFKMESHNHPSALAPFSGAATGVGGIVRDIVAMGARPVAFLDSLRFGRPSDVRTRPRLEGVVAGISAYANCIGVPTVGGELRFDASYDDNCLVNVFCCGVASADRVVRATAGAPGNLLVVLGNTTGRDGVGGAMMASGAFAGAGADPAAHAALQHGDPFLGKLLLEATLALAERGLLVGVQDMGAAGLLSSSTEMVARAGLGAVLTLDRVPRRDVTMGPREVLLSESQERMLLAVAPDDVAAVMDVARTWRLAAAVIGVVTDDGVWRARWEDSEVAALPAHLAANPAPDRHPARTRPPEAPPVVVDDTAVDWTSVLLRMLSDVEACDRAWVWRQYDHQVGVDTVRGPGDDAACVRVRGTPVTLAFACDGNARHVRLDARLGAAGQVAECLRNLACVGATPVGLTDCLNFGRPSDPLTAHHLAEAVAGIAEACRAFDVPVVSGNVSLSNTTGARSVAPTPIVAAVGVREGATRVSGRLSRDGLVVALLGRDDATCRDPQTLGGSLYLRVLAGDDARGRLPALDLGAERALHDALRRLVDADLLATAHDLSDGGLLLALAELGLPARDGAPAIGGTYVVADAHPVCLVGEAHGRALVAYDPADAERVRAAAGDVPVRVLGMSGGPSLCVRGPDGEVLVACTTSAVVDAWTRTLPEWLDP